jgi:hypothetical protein
MNRNGLNPMANPELHTGKEVAVERVNPSWTQESDEMESAAGLPQSGAELHQRLDMVEVTALNALGDPDQILRDHSPGA